jgi:hypothetical protein
LKAKKDVMDKNILYNTIVQDFPKSISNVFVDSCLELFEDIAY